MASVEHPSLATIFGVEIWRQTPVLVVEHLSGGTLATKLLAGRLEIREAIAIAVPLADALGVLHREGMLHRDIKPSNIGFARNGTPKLLDFGLARLLERSTAHPSPEAALSRLSSEQSSRTTVAGTPLYLSPELLSGAPPAERDDLWAFAVVFVEALAGVNPFIASTVGNVLRRIRDVDVLDLRDWREDMPDAVQDFCRKALHPEAGQRYRSAVEMAAALRTLSGTQ